MCISGKAVLFAGMLPTHTSFQDDKSYLAVDREDAKPSLSQGKHHQFRYSSCMSKCPLTHLFSGLLCYFIYWLIQLPFMLLSPHKVRYLFFVKGVVVPPAWLAMVIWAFVRVPPSSGLFAEHTTVTGTQFSWNWLSAMNSALGIYSSLSVNIPDFTVSFLSPILYGLTYCHASVMRKTRKRNGS